jgi:hypothetical protein
MQSGGTYLDDQKTVTVLGPSDYIFLARILEHAKEFANEISRAGIGRAGGANIAPGHVRCGVGFVEDQGCEIKVVGSLEVEVCLKPRPRA